MGELSENELNHIAGVIAQGPYEGYPDNRDRLFISDVLEKDGQIHIPDGPWHVSDHPNRQDVPSEQLDPEIPGWQFATSPPDLFGQWRAAGYEQDQYGRPLRPYWRQLLAHPDIGLPTGVGFFYRYGANKTCDAGIIRTNAASEPEILLIQRKVGRRWALPGGFIDAADLNEAAAARREVKEETGVDVGGKAEVIIQKTPVGVCTTLHSWTVNTVVSLRDFSGRLHDIKPIASGDAEDVGWFTHRQIDENLELYNSHGQYIDKIFKLITRQG